MFQFSLSAPASVAGSSAASEVGTVASESAISVDQLVESQVPGEDDEGGEKAGCPVCGEPVNRGKKYCPKHHRAYECLETSHVKKGSEIEAASFWKIFGRRGRKATAKKPALSFIPCDQPLANETLLEFCKMFPDGKETKVGKKRGSMSLVSVANKEGARQSQDDVERRRLYDQELFTNAMKNKRGWTQERAKAEWEKLVASTPEEQKKYGGISGAPLQIPIPPHLLGEQFDENRAGKFDEHAVETRSKAENMTRDEDKFKKLLQATNAGLTFQ